MCRLTIFRRPFPSIDDTIKVVIHDAAILKTVLIIALLCPSSTATAELNDGLFVKK